MTNIYLITGFLGAGKTTFLNEQLRDSSSRTGVLMNEFGKVSMDSVNVTQNGIDLKELTNGSIFCACLKDRFIDGLSQLVSRELDNIYIESSGLSDPSNMESVMDVLRKTLPDKTFEYRGSICLLDGVYFFEELDKLVSVERQIKHSHYILINKVDLIDEDKIKKIKDKIISINPLAQVGLSEYGKNRDLDSHLNYFPIIDEETTNKEDNKPKQLVMTFVDPPSKDQLYDFLKEVSPGFYRIKGFVEIDGQCMKIDGVHDHIEILPYEWNLSKGKGYNDLVFLSSKGLASISLLAGGADKYLPGIYKLAI